MVFSMRRACGRAKIFVVDLGLSKKYLNILTRSKVEIVSPPYAMPEYLRKFERGSTGFKPFIIASVMRRCDTVLYVDASIRPNSNSTSPDQIILCPDGDLRPEMDFSLLLSRHSNREWTHPQMYTFFSFPRALDTSFQFQGGALKFNSSSRLWNDILCRWLFCAMHKPCLLPHNATLRGSPGVNAVVGGLPYRLHRDDQSALNLALQDALMFRGISASYPGLLLNGQIVVRRGEKATKDELDSLLRG